MDFLPIEIPSWIQTYVLVGAGLVAVAVPGRMLWKATRGARERRERVRQFADRVRERFSDVRVSPGIFGAATVHFRHEGRPVVAYLAGDKTLILRLDEPATPRLPLVIKTKSTLSAPFTLVGLRLLPRLTMLDPLLDEGIAIYAAPALGALLHEQYLDSGSADERKETVQSSLVVLRKLPGVRRFRLFMDSERPFVMRLRLRADDLLYRPDELESLVHHMQRLHDELVPRA